MTEPAQPAGTVRVVTDKPVEIEVNPGPLARLRIWLRRRPWLAPAAILGLVGAYLLLRRR